MKNRHILIIAANAREGGKYAKYADLPNFTYRVVRAASTITGIQSVDVHLVDGFEKRPDAGAILAKLRWARDIDYYSTSMPPEPVKDEGDGMGEQLDLLHLVQEQATADFERGRRHKSVDPVIEIVPVVEKFDGSPDPARDARALEEMIAEGGPTFSQPAAESLDHVVPDNTAAEQAEGAPATTPKPRRKRCKVCGRLTYKPFDDDREGHDEKAHASQSLFA